MTYNLRLFWRMAYRSFFQTKGTHGELRGKRLRFVLLFYALWPAYALLTHLFFLLDDLLFPAYKQQPIEKPLFIMGNFRSGSTFLHRLLARDGGVFTTLRVADIFFAPSVTQKKFLGLATRLDALLGHPFKNLLAGLDRHSLGQVRIHRIGLFKPEEDENLLFHAWSTFFVVFLFPFLDELPPYQFFDDAIPEAEQRQIMAFYKSCVQRHLYATGGKRHFVAKNPLFSAKIRNLAETFPEARIIYLVRNPLDMLPSTLSWFSYAWHVFTSPLERYPYREEILTMTQYWYRHPLEYLDAHPAPERLILSYDDLIGNPERVIRGLYRRFGYPERKGLEKIVAEAVEDAHSYKSDHVYSYEEMGFTRQQIVEAYADIFARFGFDRREPTLAEVATLPEKAAMDASSD